MIPWKKYDPDNPPEFGKEFIIRARGPYDDKDHLCIAELIMWTNGQLIWTENFDKTSVNDVTHYGEINLPDESRATEENLTKMFDFDKGIDDYFKKG